MWKQIPEFSKYEASQNGMIRNRKTKRVLKPQVDPKGYHRLILYDSTLKKCPCKVHVLVLSTFVRARGDGQVCRHLDGDPSNNSLENLAWGSPQENAQDRKEHHRKWFSQPMYLETDQVQEIWDLRESGLSAREVGRRYSSGHRLILAIWRNERWREFHD